MEEAAPGFETAIKPLFRERDRKAMTFLFDLWSYDDVRAHAGRILTNVESGEMPCDGVWAPEQVERFRRWVDGGCRP